MLLRTFARGLAVALCPALCLACGGDKSAPPGAYDTSTGASGTSADGAGGAPPKEPCATPPSDPGDTSLFEAYEDYFRFGVALNGYVFSDRDLERSELAAKHFNRTTAENAMKWGSVQPLEGAFEFEPVDTFIEFAEARGMQVHGHTLVWHQQTPEWVFQDENGDLIDREGLLARLEDHMSAFADRYGSRIAYWDVVNEALDDAGGYRSTSWRSIIGNDYMVEAYMMADRYFPDAKLVYNDYSLWVPAKRDAAINMIAYLRSSGARVDAIGMQGHYDLVRPAEQQLDEALTAFGDADLEVLITELDVDVLPREGAGANISDTEDPAAALDPYTECLTRSADAAMAARWATLFEVFVRHADIISSVTVWGLDDGMSWLNNWPVQGRTNHPLLFDRELQPKSSYFSVIRQATR